MAKPLLFQPYKLRSVELKNRVAMSPMCMYSAVDGVPHEFHKMHYLTRAAGGVGLVICEATGVVPEGRITPGCTGLWGAEHVAAWKPIVEGIVKAGAVAGIQIGHAGRKGSCGGFGGAQLPLGEGGWETVAPSAIAFQEGERLPRALTLEEIAGLVKAFVAAAENALAAGFKVLEIHAAHGYLLHEFFSPLSNTREDAYGGSFENRTRILHDIVDAVRGVWPAELPMLVRISASDWAEHAEPAAPGPGWAVEDSIRLAADLKARGHVDLIDTSSGALLSYVPMGKLVAPAWQAPYAGRIRAEAGIATGAVGVITTAAEAEGVLAAGHADIVLLARELLRNPMWPLLAASELGVGSYMDWPIQYRWAYVPPKKQAEPAKAAEAAKAEGEEAGASSGAGAKA